MQHIQAEALIDWLVQQPKDWDNEHDWMNEDMAIKTSYRQKGTDIEKLRSLQGFVFFSLRKGFRLGIESQLRRGLPAKWCFQPSGLPMPAGIGVACQLSKYFES